VVVTIRVDGHNGPMQMWLAPGGGGTGGLVDVAAARLSVLDRAVTIGAGVFETVKVVDGQPFAITRHLHRLRRSAAAMAIDAPDDELLRMAITTLVDAERHSIGSLGRMRITVTQGRGELADPYAAAGPPSWFVTLAPMKPWPPSAVVATSAYRRNPRSALAGVKSTSYAENAIALFQARAVGADEALLLTTDDYVCEGTGSNIFVVISGELLTPDLGSGCLAGITRDLVVEFGGCTQRPIHASELDGITEAFLTSSTRDIWPIRDFDGRSLPVPGPVTRAAMDTWRTTAANTVDP
jgi:branched-chain amino acid aminotransferase